MRLAYMLGSYPQPSETFIAREITGMRARGHLVDVFSLFVPPGGPQASVEYGWPTGSQQAYRKLLPQPAARALGRRWGQQLAARHYDLVVAHFGSLPSGIALALDPPQPFVLSLHARDIYVEGEELAVKMARARAVVTCTGANLHYLRDCYPSAFARLHLVYHGLPAAWTDAPVPPRERAMGAPLHLLAVGRLVPKKGFHVLLQACARLRDDGVSFRLSILGDGPQRAEMERLCARLELEGRVQMPGWAREEEVRAAYSWADVFCCPSVIASDGDRDGLPNVLVEALSTGLPAVGSSLSGIPEAIEHGVNGMLVAPDDPVLLAETLARLRDPHLRAGMGAAAARHIRERFQQHRWLDRLEDILLAACGMVPAGG